MGHMSPSMSRWISMNIYGVRMMVAAYEVITLQMERIDVSRGIFHYLAYKLAIVGEM